MKNIYITLSKIYLNKSLNAKKMVSHTCSYIYQSHLPYVARLAETIPRRLTSHYTIVLWLCLHMLASALEAIFHSVLFAKKKLVIVIEMSFVV